MCTVRRSFRTAVLVAGLALGLGALGTGAQPATTVVDERSQLATDDPVNAIATVRGGDIFAALGACEIRVDDPAGFGCQGALLALTVDAGGQLSAVGELVDPAQAASYVDVVVTEKTVFALREHRDGFPEPNRYDLIAVDARVPGALRELSRQKLPDDMGEPTLAQDGTNLFVGGYQGLFVFDAGDPARLQPVSTIEGEVTDLALEAPYLLLASPTGLRVVDISEPSAPRMVGQVDGRHDGVFASGGRQFATRPNNCLGQNGWDIPCGSILVELDLSTPAAPAAVWSGKSAEGRYILDVAVSGRDLLVATNRGLEVLDAQAMTEIGGYAPSYGGSFGVTGGVRAIASAGSNLVVASRSAEHDALHTLKVTDTTPRTGWLAVPQVHAQQEGRFGVGEADQGDTIKWADDAFVLRDAFHWPPSKGVTQRKLYNGSNNRADGTWWFSHTPDSFPEGLVHIGNRFKGIVSNGASDPLVSDIDVFWVSHNQSDIPAHGPIATAYSQWTDSLGTYNRMGHNLAGPGGTGTYTTRPIQAAITSIAMTSTATCPTTPAHATRSTAPRAAYTWKPWTTSRPLCARTSARPGRSAASTHCRTTTSCSRTCSPAT